MEDKSWIRNLDGCLRSYRYLTD